MNFSKGGEYLDASTLHTCTSRKNLGQSKNVLPAQTAYSIFRQHCFSKLLVGPTFDFAKTLISKVVGLEFWRRVTRAPSLFDPGVERSVSMPTLAWSDHAKIGMGMAAEAPPDPGRRRPVSPHAPARPSTPPFLPHLPAPKRRQGERRTAAAQTPHALADAPPRRCAAGTPLSAYPPPHGPVRRQIGRASCRERVFRAV